MDTTIETAKQHRAGYETPLWTCAAIGVAALVMSTVLKPRPIATEPDSANVEPWPPRLVMQGGGGHDCLDASCVHVIDEPADYQRGGHEWVLA